MHNWGGGWISPYNLAYLLMVQHSTQFLGHGTCLASIADVLNYRMLDVSKSIFLKFVLPLSWKSSTINYYQEFADILTYVVSSQ